MNNRTPLLLGAMMLVCAVWAGDQFGLLAFVDNWGKGNQAALEKTNKAIATLNDVIEKGIAAGDRLDRYEERSLPFNTELARSQYQAWLSNLVRQNSLSQSSVEVAMPVSVTVKDGDKKREAYKRYGFKVNGIGTLQQLTRFLYEFYDAGHLHKINSLSMAKSGNGRFNLNIGGEALGISTCNRESDLSDASGDRLAKSSVEDYSQIVRRNIFSREVGAILKQISLSSITYDKSGLPEAWFKVDAKETTKKLQRGAKFSISVHEIEVIDIQPRSALLIVDGSVVDLPLGKSLHDAMTAPVARRSPP